MKINHPFNPQPLGTNQFEQKCGVCGEPMILEVGDRMHVHVGNSGTVEAILCVRCFKRSQKKKRRRMGR